VLDGHTHRSFGAGISDQADDFIIFGKDADDVGATPNALKLIC